jgi:hypothetical protein
MNFRIRPKQWYRTLGGEIVYCVGRLPKQLKDTVPCRWWCVDNGAYILTYTPSGRFFADKEDHRDIVEHLPECTGFKWVPPPKLQLREGAWYERKDGLIVGPCEKRDPSQTGGFSWAMNSWMYYDDGTNTIKHTDAFDIVREVDPPKPPQPKYRPFRSMEEFAPFRERWWRCKNHKTVLPPCHYNDTRHGGSTWVDRFARYVFEDGSPFGIIDNE